MTRSPSITKCRGFTIVELLVSAAITAGLALILVGIVSNVLSSVGRTSGSLLSNNQAKLALNHIAQDLQSAVMRSDGNVWFAVTIQPDQAGRGDSGAVLAEWNASGIPKPRAVESTDQGSSLNLTPGEVGLTPEQRHIEAFRFGMAGAWLRLFVNEPDSNDGVANRSTIRAVGWQIIRYRSKQTSESLRYGLFRSWVRPYDVASGVPEKSVFHVGYNLFSIGSTANYNNPGAGNDNEGDPGSIRRPIPTAIPNTGLLVANNVIDFGVRLWTSDAAGNWTVVFPRTDDSIGFAARPPPPDASSPNIVPPTPSSGAPSFSQMAYGFPNAAEIFVRVLTDEGAVLIENIELGRAGLDRPTEYASDQEWWWGVAIAHSIVYTRRVEIKAKAL